MAFLTINNFRIFCANKSESLQHFIDMKIDVKNPDRVQPIRENTKIWSDAKNDRK